MKDSLAMWSFERNEICITGLNNVMLRYDILYATDI